MLNYRSLPAFPFNADLTDCLLTALPDFQSLQAFISSSKFVYPIFRCRQHSILGAVALSQFGVALPPAMRLVSWRFWLLAAVYGPGAQVVERLGYSNGNYLQLKDSIATKQMTFFLGLGEIELLGVGEAYRFLLDLAKLSTPRNRHDLVIETVFIWSGVGQQLHWMPSKFRGKRPYLRPIDSQWYGICRAMTHAFFASEIASITGGRVLSTTQQRFVLDDHFLKTVDSNETYLPSLSIRDSLWSFCKRYKDWKKDDWLCTHYMTKLLSDNIQTWFDENITDSEVALRCQL
ncbi:hypothetical protein OG21DRAFT_1577578 [Imleria badia]|nr:hypothetical protein OG21DRAFT_1577578 [Imleria badia]